MIEIILHYPLSLEAWVAILGSAVFGSVIVLVAALAYQTKLHEW